MFAQRYNSLPLNTDSQYIKIDIILAASGMINQWMNATFFAFLMANAIQFLFSIKIQWRVCSKDDIKYNHMLFYDPIKS